MNNLFKKIAIATVGLVMAIGVGVGIGSASNGKVKEANAASGTFTKVTSAPTDWSGEYIIAYESGTTAYCWTGVDAVSCNVTTTITSGSITGPATACTVTVDTMTGGYSVMVNGGTNDGKYMKNASSNGIVFQEDAVATTFTYENKSVTMTCGGKNFRYNNASGNNRFRYFGSAQQVIQLYKKVVTKTITYDKNDSGASGTMSNTTGSDPEVAECGFTAPSGKAFSHWYTKPSGTGGTRYNPGDKPGESVDLYAIWKTVSSIAVTTPPTKTTYTVGESFDSAGMVVTATFSDASTSNVTSGCTFTPDPLTLGTTSVTVSYGGQTTTQAVVVNEKQNLGGIVDGEKYFLIVGDHVLKAGHTFTNATINTYTTDSSDTSSLTESDAWLFTSAGSDDAWYITFGETNYLGTGDSNSGMTADSTQSYWTVKEGTGTYDSKLVLQHSTTSRYISFTNFTSWIRAYSNLNNGNCEVSFVHYVAPASITSVEFTGDMSKKDYYVGDAWDYSGIKLQANKSDETSEDLGAISALISSGDLEIEADPTSPASEVTSVTISGLYGNNALEAEITITGITVSSPRSITGVAITGDMTNKSYTVGDAWNYAGLNMTVTYDEGDPDVVALSTAVEDGDIDFTPNPATATAGTTTLTLGSIEHISFEGEISDKVITGITVAAVPGRINFGTTSGYWNPTASGATTTDNLGSEVTITSNSGAAYSQQSSDYKQIGTNSNPATEVLITIDLTDRAGVDSVSLKFAGAATRSNHTVLVYGDTTSDVILNGAISGSNTYEISTGQEYTKINADYIHVKFTGNVDDCGGVKVFYIQYSLGAQVKEFGTLESIEVDSSSQHETVFKVDETFSSSGLVLLATDTTGFTKLINSGFTTSKDGVEFTTEAEDVEVVVTLILKGVTKTCSYTIDVIDPPTYSLASTLYEGQKVLLGAQYSSKTYVAGALNGKYLESVEATLDGSAIEFTSDATEFTVEYYGFNITLRSGAYYLKFNGDRDITFTATLDSSCVWSFNGSSLVPINNSGYEMRYNGGSPRFTTYSTGGQTAIGLYVSSATPKDATNGAATFAQKYLHMRDYTVADGSCMNDSDNHYYEDAKAFYTSASFSADEKTEFAKMTDAVARLQAWARANGETFDPSTKSFSGAIQITPLLVVTNNTNTVIVTVIIAMISATCVGGYFFLRKKKED